MKYPLEERLIWFKGSLVPIREAKIMVFSPTAQFGLNVFEGIPCYWNEKSKTMFAFRLEDHYRRLMRSAALLGIQCPYTMEEMEKALKDTVRANEFREDLSVRQTLFVDDFGSWSSSGPVEMFVVPTPRKNSRKEYVKKGLDICIASWRRISENDLSPRIKCGANYLNSRAGQLEAVRNGYDTCLFLNEAGKIAEGPGSCFFMVRGREVITPELTDSVLESITRDSVIQIAGRLGYTVKVRTIDRTETYTADEAFLCGSAMEITPVYSIDRHMLSSESPVIGEILKAYLSAAKGETGLFADWITPVEG